MKVSAIPTIITFIISAVLGYLAYSIADGHFDKNSVLIGIGTMVSVLATLGTLMACSLKNSKTNINMKAWSSLTFILIIIANFCFAIFGSSVPIYLAAIVILILIHLFVVWKLYTVNDV